MGETDTFLLSSMFPALVVAPNLAEHGGWKGEVATVHVHGPSIAIDFSTN